MYTRNEKIVPVYIEDEVKDSYLNYAMSVIVGRALPDVRDGLKPVHRRILFAMQDLGLEHTKPFKKAARIVGDQNGPGFFVTLPIGRGSRKRRQR
jgi:DNA gyrase subunit A